MNPSEAGIMTSTLSVLAVSAEPLIILNWMFCTRSFLVVPTGFSASNVQSTPLPER